MGVTKTDIYTSEQNEIAVMAKAFSHPARVAILQHLLKCNTCINGDLVSELGLAQATISQHLRELKEIGIIKGSIEGSKINYCISADRWDQVRSTFAALFGQFNGATNQNC